MSTEQAPPVEECPGWFQWSAFGASYPDTYCVDGVLFDADADGGGAGGDIPCPFLDADGFTEWMIGGMYRQPICSVCQQSIPNDAKIDYHDGHALTWTATCPNDGRVFVLMYDYEAEIERLEFEAGEEA